MRTVKTTTTGAAAAIRMGQDFETHGALSGGWEPLDYGTSTGRMPHRAVEKLREVERAARERGLTRVYVIRSYATPIGLMFEDGTTWEPGVKYSVTTSKHQGQARHGMALYAERVASGSV